MKKCSILIASHNKHEYLRHTLACLVRQTYPYYEIILVDDVSDPPVREVPDGVSLLRMEGTPNVSRARNRGIAEATGEVILLTDDDLLVREDWVACHMQHHQHTEDNLIIGAVKRIEYHGEPHFWELPPTTSRGEKGMRRRLAGLFPWKVCGANTSVARQKLIEAGLFCEEYQGWGVEDVDLSYRLWQLGLHSQLEPRAVAYHQQHPPQLRREESERRNQWLFVRRHGFWPYGTPPPDFNGPAHGPTHTPAALAVLLRRWQQANALPDDGGDDAEREPQSQPAFSGDSNEPLTSIVILCCNQLNYTRLCIESVMRHTDAPYELVFVDNGSTDGTLPYLVRVTNDANNGAPLSSFCRRVVLIRNEGNLGFCKGVNQGIAAARGQYLLLLNNDTVVTPGWLSRLIEHAESAPNVGLVGAVSNYAAAPQQVAVSYRTLDEMYSFAAEITQKQRGRSFEWEWVVGLCLLIKREVINTIGMLDERFGLGFFDDDDLSLRARQAGYKILIAQDVFIHHFGSRTFLGLGVNVAEQMKANFGKFREKWGEAATRYWLPPEEWDKGKPKRRPFRVEQTVETSLSATSREKKDSYYHFPRPELVELVPLSAKRILDVGCAAGKMGEALKQRAEALGMGEMEVIGIEIVPEVVQEARSRLNHVIVGDVETVELPFSEGEFDALVFGDVLEHLRNPWAVLKRLVRHLAPEGVVIASLPNVRHHTVIARLLDGDWTYEGAGILDVGHLRFFTRRAMEHLFTQAGLRVVRCQPAAGGGYQRWVEAGCPTTVSLGRVSLQLPSVTEAEEFYAVQYRIVAELMKEG
jgi:GT2 family glycosyltransferase/2-polyprenyl-3-methyl-5-hydroxy-6-metoxy-1,4-benzoquinol methylase